MGQIIRLPDGAYVCPEEGEGPLSSQAELLELVALCGEAGTDKLLFPKNSLADDFFDLSTGLAGEISLKLNIYRVKTAFVVDLEVVASLRFKEWVRECNRGKEIHFASCQQDAVEWLLE